MEELEIILKEIEYKSLLKYIVLPKNISSHYENNNIYLKGKIDCFDEVLDKLSTILVEKGIDDDGELNSTGYELESLIDLFSILYE